MKITRATLTPYNEYGISKNVTHKHWPETYLSATGDKIEFPEARLSYTLMKLRTSSYLPFNNHNVSHPLPPPSPHTMSKLRTHLMIRELIRKRWQWGFTTLNFHQTISTSPFATGRTTGAAGCLWVKGREQGRDQWRKQSEGLMPLIRASKGQKQHHILSPHI